MKSFLFKVATGLALTTTGVVISQTPAQAAKKVNPKITTVQKYDSKRALLTRTLKTNYLWNAKHTKKLANLKNYSKTTFYASKLVAMRFPHYQYSVNYYYVTSSNHKLKGYVWAKSMVQGKSYKGGYFSYPKYNILLSTTRARNSKDLQNDGQSAMDGYSTNSSLSAFAKTPSLSSMKKVLSYYRKHDGDKTLPWTLRSGAKRAARIVTEKSWTGSATNNIIKIPVVEFAYGKSSSYWYNTRTNFAVAKDVMNTNRKHVKTYVAKNSTSDGAVYLNGIRFNFNDSDAQYASNFGSTISKVYSNNVGPNHNLSLVEFYTKVQYVLTSSIMYINPTKPILKNGIWYGSGQAISGNKAGRAVMKALDPNKSKVYRLIGTGGFTQYKYESGKWNYQFSIRFMKVDKSQTKVSDDATEVDVSLWTQGNQNKTIDTISATTDVRPYLYKSTEYYQNLINREN